MHTLHAAQIKRGLALPAFALTKKGGWDLFQIAEKRRQALNHNGLGAVLSSAGEDRHLGEGGEKGSHSRWEIGIKGVLFCRGRGNDGSFGSFGRPGHARKPVLCNYFITVTDTRLG